MPRRHTQPDQTQPGSTDEQPGVHDNNADVRDMSGTRPGQVVQAGQHRDNASTSQQDQADATAHDDQHSATQAEQDAPTQQDAKETRPEDLPTYDGSTPLTSGRPAGRHESYCQLRATGETQAESYKMSGNRRLKSKNAGIAASNLEAVPKVARRIAYLKMLQRQGRTQQDTSAPVQEPVKPQSQAIKHLDRDTVLQSLTIALNNAVGRSAAGEIAQVAKQIRDYIPSITRETAEDMPDPLAVVTYLCNSATKRPSDIRRELRGMEWILGRVQAITRCPPDQLLAAAQTVANTVATREAKRTSH